MKLHRLTIAVLVVMTAAGGAAQAQEPKPAPVPELVVPARPPSRPTLAIPLEVQVIISRYQGEKKVSSLPYTLAVNANSEATQLNIGGDVPIPMTTFTPAGDGKPSPLVSFQYKNIGTSINCRATSIDDGRFDLRVEIDESSVYTSGDGAKTGESPSFRSFRARNTLLLRDGQTRQYTAATDRVSGETIRIEVTLRVVK
ncbi:MAG TPA: hypothetical protein VFO58_19930 [Vicinamibacterales bacterium]|nr:hypothetical protein [Vicinamibacterales bacterium]